MEYNSLKLVNLPIKSIKFDKVNPRNADSQFFQLLELSLRRLGLLSPIYIDQFGKILSGHQRAQMLLKLGYSEIPVVIVKIKEGSEFSAASNVMFNRVLQEFSAVEEDYSVLRQQALKYLDSLSNQADVLAPLKNMRTATKEEIEQVSSLRLSRHQILPAQNLYLKYKIMVPVIVCDGKIINGTVRGYVYTKMKKSRFLVVEAPAGCSLVFKAITAMYDMERIRDVLRVGARRSLFTIKPLAALTSFIPREVLLSSYSLKWYYHQNFSRILDFGCGNAQQSAPLRQMGVNITLFEPFVINKQGQFGFVQTRKIIEAFLDDIEANGLFDLVYSNAVLNSVPFEDDRRKVVTLMKFLSSGAKVFVTSTRCNLRRTVFKSQDSTGISSSRGLVKLQASFTKEQLHEYFDY